MRQAVADVLLTLRDVATATATATAAQERS